MFAVSLEENVDMFVCVCVREREREREGEEGGGEIWREMREGIKYISTCRDIDYII